MQPIVQLTLGIPLKDEATFANFYAAKNAEIVAELKKTASGVGEASIYICATRSQGCSHLLQASCHYAHQHQLRSIYLPLASLITHSASVLEGFEPVALVCLDDLEVIAGKPEWEKAVFHLYNRIYDAGGHMLFAADDLPQSIHLILPDLISRLSAGMVYQLHPLTDTEKLFALTMHAEQRGINLSEEVGKYILTHCPRHMGTLLSVLDVLDRASLAAQRRLTIPFVKEVLQL
jgi:DnaA family protein